MIATEATSTSSRQASSAQDRIDLKALKQSIDLLALVRKKGHEPTRHGNGKWKITCPFHDDQEASLVITESKNLWQCFGCGRGGSPIDFIMESDHLTTGQAIRELAEQSHGLIRPASELITERKPMTRTPEQQKLLNKVADFYHKTFLQAVEGRGYLKCRGLVEPALYETFRIGYADSTILDAIPPEGEMIEDLQSLGILDQHKREHFRDCVVFPIYDQHGNVVEMYGRKIIEDTRIKHLYLPGQHAGIFNHTCARTSSYLLLTESLIDSATLWQAGYKNTTACYGTNGLTEDHLKLFETNQVERLYLVMDGDDAGRRGAERVAEKTKHLGIEIFVVALPEGEDPNSYFENHKIEDFDALLKTAKPISAPSAGSAREIPQSEITRKQGTARIEDTNQGFRVSFEKRSYDVRMIDGSAAKLRATIKALTGDRNRFHIDTVDLYAARSRKSFIADVVKLYHEEPSIIEIDINRIIEQCETRTENPSATEQEVIRLTDKDRREAERLARRKDLLDVIAKDFVKCGYVGEKHNVLLAYLTMTGRKMKNPLAMLILSGSGSGKSALQDAALNFCPEEDLVKLTSITERALFYKGETALKHKVLALEEVAGAEDAAYAIRSLISSGVLVIETTIKDPLTGRMTTMENKVYGPTAVFQTTTNPEIDPETRSRFIITSIDESREQTKAILEAQRNARTLEGFKLKLQREALFKRHHALQRILRPVAVLNPYGSLLTYTDQQLLTRRDQPKYLDLIETIAFLHQYQKAAKRLTIEGQAVEYIEVSLRDITLANELATEILGKSLDELNGPSRRLLLLIDKMVREREADPKEATFTRRDVRSYTRWSDYQVKTHIRQLEDLEYLLPVSGRNGQQYRYSLVWHGEGLEGEKFMLDLKPVDQLRKEAQALGIVDEGCPSAGSGLVGAQLGGDKS